MNKAKNKRVQLREFRKLKDQSLRYLVNKAYHVLGNPIILCNLDWEILAYAEGVITNDPIWNQHISSGILTDEMKDFGIDEGYAESLTSASVVKLFHSDKLEHDRLAGKLFGEDGMIMAIAIVVSSDRPFEDGDEGLLEGICKKLSTEMDKVGRYKDHGQKTLEFYLNKLIETDIRNDRHAISYIEIIYKGLKNYLYAAVADIGQCDPTYTKLDFYRDQFKRIRPAFKYSIYSKYIVMIMSTDEGPFYPKKCFHRLNKLFEQDNIRVGISSRFENLFDLSRYYHEAVAALTKGLTANVEQKIFVHSDAGS